jgi:hypothetical protein
MIYALLDYRKITCYISEKRTVGYFFPARRRRIFSMKKIIALLVVFALFAGSAFAADIGVDVHASARLAEGASGQDDIITNGSLDRVRIGAGGETEDGVFGAWFRMDGIHWSGGFDAQGLAWWKPLDFLKVQLSSNPDGHWGKDGVSRWMFYQTATDTSGLTDGGANSWGGGLYGWNGDAGGAFFGGVNTGLMLEITPLDILGINIALPFGGDATWEDNFNNFTAQVAVNLDFGNFALTYQGQGEKKGYLRVYAGLPISIINLDVGFGLPFDSNDGAVKAPVTAGLALKAGISDAFAIKFRTYAFFGGDDKAFKLTADVMPYFAISDSLSAFLAFGVGMLSPDSGDATIGFNVNPYIIVGSEWGPKFLAGFKVNSDGVKDADDKTTTKWALVIGMQVGF